jgi:polyisoprenoid-binding protein YceI
VHAASGAARPMAQATVRYLIDAKRSTFTVQAFSTGLLSAFGHSPRIAIRDLEGDVEFVAAGPKIEGVRLHMRIRADSLEVVDDISDKDRREIQHQMFEDVLETKYHPEIVFDCSQATANGYGDRYWVALNGELALHGETHRLPISARVVVTGDSLRASGEFQVRQSDYGIAPVKVAGGAIKLKDEVKCTFDIVARKQE